MSRTLFGFLLSNKRKEDTRSPANDDIAKVFFDSFSKRVGNAEETIRYISTQLEKVKLSVDRGQLSDLVLLDRIQRLELIFRESVGSIKGLLENEYRTGNGVAAKAIANEESSTQKEHAQAIETAHPSMALPTSPVGEIGSLQSITTPTELQVLMLLAAEGPKSAPEIGKVVGRSREHTARLMKKLYEEGYIRRDQVRIPFKYSLVEKVRQSLKKTEVKGEAKEPISVPQT